MKGRLKSKNAVIELLLVSDKLGGIDLGFRCGCPSQNKIAHIGFVLFSWMRMAGWFDAEHLHGLDTLSSCSSIDPEQVEEDYFYKTERSRYVVVYKRKKSRGEKAIDNIEADHDKSFEEQPIEEKDQGIKS